MRALIALILVSSFAVAAESIETARIINVKHHELGRIAFWEGRVPIDDGYPFYDLTLQIGEKKYVVRYESGTGYIPSAWKNGADIKIRMGGRGRMYLFNGTEEVPVVILNNQAQDCVLRNTPHVARGPGSQVSCD